MSSLGFSGYQAFFQGILEFSFVFWDFPGRSGIISMDIIIILDFMVFWTLFWIFRVHSGHAGYSSRRTRFLEKFLLQEIRLFLGKSSLMQLSIIAGNVTLLFD